MASGFPPFIDRSAAKAPDWTSPRRSGRFCLRIRQARDSIQTRFDDPDQAHSRLRSCQTHPQPVRSTQAPTPAVNPLNPKPQAAHPDGGTRPKLPRVILISALLAAFVVWAVALLWRSAENRLRAEWLWQTRQIRDALPTDFTAGLTGTAQDLLAPEYHLAKRRLARIREDLNNCRFIYIVGLDSNGGVFFYLDSEPPGSPDESTAGQPYTTAPTALAARLRDRQEWVTGPYVDSYGRWISAFVPMHGSSPMAIALDASARDWTVNITQRILPEVGLGLVTLACGLYFFFGLSRTPSAKTTRNPDAWTRFRDASLFIGPVLTLGLLGILALYSEREDRSLSQQHQEAEDLQASVAQIRLLDERLTASALLAVRETTDAWLRRHGADAEALTNLIASSRIHSPAELADLLLQLDQSKERRLATESRALAAAARGDHAQAAKLLSDPSYEENKSRHAEVLARMEANLSTRLALIAHANDRSAQRQRVLLGLAFVIALLNWGVIRRVLDQRNRAEATALRALSSHKNRLAEEVAIRTAQLAESESRFRTLFENLGQGVVAHSPHGQILELNPAAARILGRSRAQLLNSSSLFPGGQLTDQNDAPLEEEPSATVLRTGRPVGGLVLGLRTETGERRWLLVDSVPLPSHTSATPAGVLTTLSDVTARHLAENALRERTRELDGFFQLALDLLAVTDTEGHIVRLNSGWTHALGHLSSRLLNSPLIDLAHPDDADFVRLAYADLRRGSPANGSIVRFRTADGGYRQIEWRAAAIERRVYIAARDVTARHEAEQTREHQRRMLEHVIETDHSGYWDWDLLAGSLYLSPGLKRMLGYDDVELPNHPDTLRTHAHPEDLARALEILDGHIKSSGRRPYLTEIRWRRRDGSWHWVRCSGGVLAWTPEGAPARMVGSHVDIHEAKISAEALAIATEEARELARQADNANRAKSEFLANMSHEIRTPLNGVLGLVGLLAETRLNPEQVSWVRGIESSGRNLLRLVNDLLDLSRVEAGRLELVTETFSPRDLLDSIANTLRPQAQAKKLAFRLETKALPDFVLGDSLRLRQILDNLLGNAVKFTEKGEIVLAATSAPARDPGSVLMRIEVHDTGPGIAAEKLDRLFQKFSQVDASLTRSHGGSGLGLALSRDLARLLGGDVSVETAQSRGAVFRVEIPFALASTPIPPEPEPAKPEPPIDVEGLRARLMGDEKMTRALLANLAPGLVRHIDDTRAALETGTAESATRALHTLKGAAANIGAGPVRAAAAAAENALRTGDQPALAEARERLYARSEEFVAALPEITRAPSAPPP